MFLMWVRQILYFKCQLMKLCLPQKYYNVSKCFSNVYNISVLYNHCIFIVINYVVIFYYCGPHTWLSLIIPWELIQYVKHRMTHILIIYILSNKNLESDKNYNIIWSMKYEKKWYDEKMSYFKNSIYWFIHCFWIYFKVINDLNNSSDEMNFEETS